MKKKPTHLSALRRNVERAMKRRSLSYREVAKITGIPHATIHRLVAGEAEPLYSAGVTLNNFAQDAD